MASIYDDIKTATELVHEVMASGMSTKDEDLVRVQDILGRSTIAELDTLANDIGRNDEHGNPDPKGAWSSNRRPTRDTFYSIIFKVWNYEEAVKFWNSHTNPEHKDLAKMRQSFKTVTKQNTDFKVQVAELTAREENARDRVNELADQVDSLQRQLTEKDAEITRLKAKLYDLIVKD